MVESRLLPQPVKRPALVRSMGRFFENRRPDYPVERTLLTTGVLAFAMESRHQGGRRLATPQLAEIRYQAPAQSVYARGAGG